MPQALLPLVPDGATRINDTISVVRELGEWTYFYGVDPIFRHPDEDRRSFRMFTAQLVCQGACKQTDIIRTFGVSANSVKRSVKKCRQQGIAAFYQPRKGRGPTVMTDEVTTRAQELLGGGCSRNEVARQLDVQYETLRKAINQGRLHEPPRSQDHASASTEVLAVADVPDQPGQACDKSERILADASAEMGIACTRPEERVLAAFGMLQGAPTRFEVCRDVSFGGVLCALPALAQNGLFEHLETSFPTLGGYYTTVQVVTVLAYMGLCRIKTVEQLQYEAPGELGKLLGLDRVPEVRCLRYKLAELCAGSAAEEWAGLLSRQWMQDNPELAGTLYVDGHVRLYHGQQTKLPRRYVARQRLCLRGTSDYWVNDALGQPFFVVERPIDHGMLEVLRNDIVPRLLKDVPPQPTEQQLQTDPHRCRFVMIFDREGYSPGFFKEMWQDHRIACVTYHKYPKEAWPQQWFVRTQVNLPGGEEVSMKLAEMGSWIGDRKNGLWVREVRKLTARGHQTSLISTAYGQLALQDAAGIFSRWSQENFFRYMMEHYAIDLLNEYRTEEIPGTNRPVVNPRWRDLDGRFRSQNGKLQRLLAQFAAHTLHPEADEAEVPKWQQRKSELVEAIEELEDEVAQVKQQRQQTPKHIEWHELPEQDQFQRLAPSRKRLVDTIKLIAYRAETAMTHIVREAMARDDDARSLVRDLFRSEADLSPDRQAGVLKVGVHPMANPRLNRAIQHLLDELNAASLTYPGTNLRLVYTLVGALSR
ncbi:MAG: putative transposase [Planctomycetota bacterium]